MTKFYQGRFVPRNPEKYEGNPSNIIYRSSWELKYMIWCDTNSSIVKWSSEETIIPYLSPIDNKMHRYYVDFKIQVKTKDGIKIYLVEVKPFNQTIPPKTTKRTKRKTKQYLNEVFTWGKNNAKWEAARRYCKERNYEFKVITEKDLF